MHIADWIIICSYLIYVLWYGLKSSQNRESAIGFFLGGRNLPWWAIGLSIMATQMSAITLIGATGQAYEDGMRFIQFYLGLPLAMVILCVTAVPLIYKAKVFTAYEYLENRFDARTRTLTSFFFLISRGLGVGVIIAAPAVIISLVLGWEEWITIFVIGLSTTFYTMRGGVQAVAWADVKQMTIIILGLMVCISIILSTLPSEISLNDALYVAGAAEKLQTIDFRFDLNEPYTFWSGTFAALFLFLSYFGCDQSQVQRYLCAKSIKESRISLLMSAFLKIPLQFLILFIGILIFIFYHFNSPPMIFNNNAANNAQENNPEYYRELEMMHHKAYIKRRDAALNFILNQQNPSEEISLSSYKESHFSYIEIREKANEFVGSANNNSNFNDINYVFPVFIVQNMPIGVIGMIIAAILAAAMSSISSELNSLATTSTMDIYRQLIKPDGSDEDFLRFGKIATVIWGIFACIVALYATDLGSLIEVVNKFGSFFYGSLLGVFILAFSLPQANSIGAFYGLIIGMISVWIISSFSEIAFLWFNVFGCLITVGVGLFISIIFKEKNH